MNSLSIHARSARLALLVALRHAGFAPWLLVAGWGLFAALQEPLLFRSFGIRLPLQAAWPAVLGLVAILVASGPRPAAATPQVLLSQALVVLCTVSGVVVLAAVELARGPADRLGPVAAWWVGSVAVATPFALLLLAARGLPMVARVATLASACVVAATLAVRFDAEPWSLRALAATLCVLAAAVALACRPPRPHAHRHPR